MRGQHLGVCIRMRGETVAHRPTEIRIGQHRAKCAVENLAAGRGETGAGRHILPTLQINPFELAVISDRGRRQHFVQSCVNVVCGLIGVVAAAGKFAKPIQAIIKATTKDKCCGTSSPPRSERSLESNTITPLAGNTLIGQISDSQLTCTKVQEPDQQRM